MHVRFTFAAALATTLLASGCASTDADTSKERVLPHEREYTTGSNMPRRSSQSGPSEVQTISRDQLEREAGRAGQLPSRSGNPQ